MVTRHDPGARHRGSIDRSPPLIRPRNASGFSLGELIVLLLLISIALFLLLMAVPRGREQARLTACQKNLSQVGVALALHDQIRRQLPAVEQLAPPAEAADRSETAPSPLKTLLEEFGLADFLGLAPGAPPPPRGPVPAEMPVPGFVCASDPNATAGRFRAPISYRGVTGSDHLGRDGLFAPNRTRRLAEIEAADGASYTAAFSERLAGDSTNGTPADWNYAIVPPPLDPTGCPRDRLDPLAWRGDAGSSWAIADYRSTLYNHGLPPQGSPSCIASNGQAAFMGASSGHTRGLNLLMLDGSVRLLTPTINLRIWREFAAIRSAPDNDLQSPTTP
jgi:prepilin-type processing-associated H-X9-DG protein